MCDPFAKKIRQRGFTLFELIIVIVMLSALGIMTSNYIGFGVDIYSSVSDRDKALSSVRFMAEKLSREIGNALPNSVEVSTSNGMTDGCLTFTPIIASSVYSDSDFPIGTSNEAENGTIVTIDNYTFTTGDRAVVSLSDREPLESSETSDNEVHEIKSSSSIDSDGEITFAKGKISFPNGSPQNRIYIIHADNDDVSYFFNDNNELLRGNACSNGEVIAENINTGSFQVLPDKLHSTLMISLIVTSSEQNLPFKQILPIHNIP